MKLAAVARLAPLPDIVPLLAHPCASLPLANAISISQYSLPGHRSPLNRAPSIQQELQPKWRWGCTRILSHRLFQRPGLTTSSSDMQLCLQPSVAHRRLQPCFVTKRQSSIARHSPPRSTRSVSPWPETQRAAIASTHLPLDSTTPARCPSQAHACCALSGTGAAIDVKYDYHHRMRMSFVESFSSMDAGIRTAFKPLSPIGHCAVSKVFSSAFLPTATRGVTLYSSGSPLE